MKAASLKQTPANPARHARHVRLTRPDREAWGSQEISLLGTDCATIQELACQIAQKLSPKYRLAFCDSAHREEEPPYPLASGFSHYCLKRQRFEERHLLSTPHRSMPHHSEHIDLLLLNGNHFEAKSQIVIANPSKAASLRKRQRRLTNVIALITDDLEALPSFVTDCLPSREAGLLPRQIGLRLGEAGLPRFRPTEVDLLSEFIEDLMLKHLPPLRGLILGGGQSRRMGAEKIFLSYHGLQQHLHLTEMLREFCQEVYVSCQTSQADQFEHPLADTFLQLGPLGGILSAFRHDPNAAWLTVACDHPLLDRAGIRRLIQERDARRMATCFYNSETKLPEPLITIWEPKAYPLLLHHLANGEACPRKALLRQSLIGQSPADRSPIDQASAADWHLADEGSGDGKGSSPKANASANASANVKMIHLEPEDEAILQNANTREEYQSLMQKIASSGKTASKDSRDNRDNRDSRDSRDNRGENRSEVLL